MADIKYLYEKIGSAIEFGTPLPEIPKYISNNLKYEFFDWLKKGGMGFC